MVICIDKNNPSSPNNRITFMNSVKIPLKSPPCLARVGIMQEVRIMVFCIDKNNPSSPNNRITLMNRWINFLNNKVAIMSGSC